MIRASYQVVPKNKVVDHLVLYNFYFGQNSSAIMKFEDLDGQNQLKIIDCGHCASPVSLSGGDATRRRADVRTGA